MSLHRGTKQFQCRLVHYFCPGGDSSIDKNRKKGGGYDHGMLRVDGSALSRAVA
jgi:hypothetical protein